MGGASRFMMLLAAPFPPLLHCPASLVFRRRLLLARHSSFTSTPRLTLLSSSPTNNTAPHPSPFSFAASNSSRSWKLHYHSQSINSESPAPAHPWPEWSNLINTLLSSQGNQSPALSPQDAFVVYEAKELSDEFIRHASLCLAFSRSRPELLGLLSRKDIEAVVSNGTPFLFKSSLDIARRMRVYLGMEGSNMMESDKATLVDVMKYLLSYASNPSVYSERNSIYSREPVESSVRNLLCQITEISCQEPVQELSASENHQFYSGMEQTPQPSRQNVEMKRGDWICPNCSFMNFARNFKCLECEETRPKNLLTGREWQCPQCNFYNYGRNMVCLRCDCQRPGPAVTNSVRSMSELGSSNFKLAENEEKSKRGIDKVSQLDNSSDLSGAAVVDTRKNPLERRQANSQSQISMGDYGNFKGDTSETSSPGKVFDSSIQQSLDHILGYSSPVSRASAMEENVQEHLPSSSPSGFGQHQEMKSASAPFVPSSGGVFPTQDENLKTKGNKNIKSESLFTSGASPKIGSVNEKAGQISNSVRNSESVTESENKDKEQAEKSGRWFQKVAELHNVKDLPSAISDEEFPEIMPLRKGENRFVISKKKDRSLTSPAYKRQAVTEQASNPKFVPFVPFPPGYFARKDTVESNDSNSPMNSSTATSPSSMVAENFSEKLDGGKPGVPEDSAVDQTGSQVRSSGDSSPNLPGSVGANVVGNASKSSIGSDSRISEHSRNAKTFQSTNGPGVSPQLPNQDPRPGWTGKSLEGSAVKEPDPLDMSEEAKAERWFRRVAQIKDISELSQIPDEDFPSIMPMRKGVNRFVVSKRKTPLERRLTSPQYRRNLPVVSSDPVKKDNDNK